MRTIWFGALCRMGGRTGNGAFGSKPCNTGGIALRCREDQLDPEYVRRRVYARLLAPCLPVRCSWLDAVSISSIQKRISTHKPSMLIFPNANIKIYPSSQCRPWSQKAACRSMTQWFANA